MKEKYILLEDIESLGKAGDVVAVLPGYARNYLVPKKLALNVSKGALRQFEARRGKIEEKRNLEIEKVRQTAAKLSTLKVEIPVNVGEDNRLFGSVTPYTIAQRIVELGMEVDHHKIQLATPIKELGSYEVKIKLHPEVVLTLKISVVKG